MLNYIWAGLIITSLVFALVSDIRDISRDTFRNGASLEVTLEFPDRYEADTRRLPAAVRIAPDTYRQHFGTDAAPADR